ncbi:hypothetical protein C7437_1011065 [Psychrobacillus insolitus]|uniref:Uncharacterized protein n=1 Tax=Psychrobacillus insolitus TaxID=1461 RepID=A0A2W7N7C6_9BACI|nr:hypothetical protein C7437_1011065 [Psychrobacillus insolitus]
MTPMATLIVFSAIFIALSFSMGMLWESTNGKGK